MAKLKETLNNLKSKTVKELQFEKEEVIKKLARLKLEKGVFRLKKVSDLIKEKKLLAQILTVIVQQAHDDTEQSRSVIREKEKNA